MITNRLVTINNSVYSEKELKEVKNTDKKTLYFIEKDERDSKKEGVKNDK